MERKFQLYQHIGDLCYPNNGWIKELNFGSWGGEPVYDIRTWNADHTRFGKGVTLTPGEFAKLRELVWDKACFSALSHPALEGQDAE